jgi:hypothetical protein
MSDSAAFQNHQVVVSRTVERDPGEPMAVMPQLVDDVNLYQKKRGSGGSNHSISKTTGRRERKKAAGRQHKVKDLIDVI